MGTRMRTSDLRRRMHEVLEDVRGGERVIVTRNGEPIAEIVPYRRAGDERVKSGHELIEELRRGPLARITDREIEAMRDRSLERNRGS